MLELLAALLLIAIFWSDPMTVIAIGLGVLLLVGLVLLLLEKNRMLFDIALFVVALFLLFGSSLP